jgi:hypothetical protein
MLATIKSRTFCPLVCCLKTKIRIYKTTISPVRLHECDTRSPSLREEQRPRLPETTNIPCYISTYHVTEHILLPTRFTFIQTLIAGKYPIHDRTRNTCHFVQNDSSQVPRDRGQCLCTDDFSENSSVTESFIIHTQEDGHTPIHTC